MGYYIASFNTAAYAIRGSHGYHLVHPGKWETIADEVCKRQASASAHHKTAGTIANPAMDAISDFGLLYFGDYPRGPIDMSTALMHRKSLAIEKEYHQEIWSRLNANDFNFSAKEALGKSFDWSVAADMLGLFLAGCEITAETRNGIFRIAKRPGLLSKMLGGAADTLGMYPQSDISDVRVEPERVDVTLGTRGVVVITRQTCKLYE